MRAALRGALMAVVEAPAAVVTSRLDVVAVNRLGQALLAPVLDRARPNLARFVFLDEDASIEFYPEWDRVADEHAQRLRAAAAADPNDKALHRLIGELSTASSEFLARWSTKRLGAGRPPGVTIRHPLVGELELVREDLAPVAAGHVAGDGQAKADALQADAERKHTEIMATINQQRTVLEGRIEQLKTFEREYRVRLKSYLESQLEELENRGSAVPVDGGDAFGGDNSSNHSGASFAKGNK